MQARPPGAPQPGTTAAEGSRKAGPNPADMPNHPPAEGGPTGALLGMVQAPSSALAEPHIGKVRRLRPETLESHCPPEWTTLALRDWPRV